MPSTHDFAFTAPARFIAADPFARRPADTDQGALRHVRRTTKVRRIMLMESARCAAQLGALPGAGEAIHVVAARHKGSGFGLWSMVPAVLELAGGATIKTLAAATLAMSGPTIAELIEMMDAGRVGATIVLVSEVFAAKDADLFASLTRELASRGGRAAADRNHAKVLCIALSDGRKYVAEGSANLRSCVAREQLLLTADDGLFAFHSKWILAAIARAAK